MIDQFIKLLVTVADTYDGTDDLAKIDFAKMLEISALLDVAEDDKLTGLALRRFKNLSKNNIRKVMIVRDDAASFGISKDLEILVYRTYAKISKL